MKLRKILFLFLLVGFKLHAASVAVLFDSANTQYANTNFEKSIVSYESIIASGYESSELYFNLGNAYFKINKIGLAILNYEKAKKLNRTDEDIAFNLKLANQKIVDKIDAVPELLINDLLNDGINSLSNEKQFSVFFLALFFLFCCFITLYFIAKKVVLKRISFFISLVLLCAMIPVFFMAKSSYLKSSETNNGIVLEQSVTAKGSPNSNGTKLFILHEGTKVKIQSFNGVWVEVKLANGDVGWIPQSAVGLF
ncbi:MAG: hypothetical protein J0M08_10585 [Bacteroidetes bacterium]|nr:hypothetical protein [Bacteroidota bacterium]